jgi:hypothetical protein
MRAHLNRPRATRIALTALLLPLSLWLGGCAAPRKAPELAAFKAARPASILVLPPINDSPDVNAPMSVLAQASLPLGEAGYYVMPVGVMMETFRQNGLSNPPDVHEVSAKKLREIFGADAALYLKVTQYGAKYTVLHAEVRATAQARLVDLRSGQTLWAGSATASNDEGNQNNSGGLIGAVVGSLVKQIIQSVTDSGHPVAGVMANRLLRAGRPGGIIWGPHSPYYGKDGEEPWR